MTKRYILHLDVDAFFASVEEILDPSLKGKPLIVGARPEQRGVVASASYAARAFGVRSAMPTAQALRLCPQAIVIPPRHKVYGEYSARMMAILGEYSPLIEPLSLDEAFLDITGCEARWGSPEELANWIQKRLEVELGLSVSIGLASNKLVAKIASGLEKPHGFVVVSHGGEAGFLAPLPVEKLWGVGEVTAKSLHEMGVFTIGQLARLPVAQLEARFGRRGRDLYQQARGLDDSPVVAEREEKSLSREVTFAEDIGDGRVLKKTLLFDCRFSIQKSEIENRKSEILSFELEERQLSLFEGTGEGKVEKLRRLDQAVDRIREKYGEEAIQRASLVTTLSQHNNGNE
ncbi:MAG: DNA polymerase IV [Anaerolineae bacterium]